MVEPREPASEQLRADVHLVGEVLGDTLREQRGDAAFALVEELRTGAIALRAGTLPGGGDAFAARIARNSGRG